MNKLDFVLSKTTIVDYLLRMLESICLTPLERVSLERLYLEASIFPPVEIESSHPSPDMLDVYLYFRTIIDTCSYKYIKEHVTFDLHMIRQIWTIPGYEDVNDYVY